MAISVNRLAHGLGTVGIVAALLIGCNKGKPERAPGAGSASAAPTDDVEAFLKNDSAPLTQAIYEKLLLRLADCKVTERGIDAVCPAQRNLTRARNHKTPPKELAVMNGQVGLKLIGNPSPAVRLQSAKLLQTALGANPEMQKAMIEAARKEKEPSVLAAMIRGIGSRVKTDDAVKQLLLELSDNPSPLVRQEALGWFVTTFGQGVPGSFDKVLQKVESDPSEDVRAYLCGRLYGSGDERAIPVFEKYLTAKDTPPKIYAACWNGAINSWTGFPRPTNPSKQGYDLTLKVLDEKPRTKDRPPWSGLAVLRAAKTDFPPNDRFGTEWYEKVKSWYKKDRLLKSLKGVAVDPNANWMARTAALRVMLDLGENKKTFEDLAKKYEKAKEGDDFQVKRQLDDLLHRGAPPAPSGSGAMPVMPGMPSGVPPYMGRHGPFGPGPHGRPGAPGAPGAPPGPPPAAPPAPPPPPPPAQP